jgi:hypothetical protein
MRTQDPANIRADFNAAIDDIEMAFNAAEANLQADGPKKLIVEYLFVAAAALFEGYVSDLFIAYINRNSEKFRAYLLGKLKVETSDDFAKRSVQFVETSMPHLSVDRIREVLDPTGYNVAFPTTDKMKEAAGRWLADAERTRFTGTSAQQCAVIDYIKAVRNFLAHRSQTADNNMQAALIAIDLPAELRRSNNNVNDVGAYLRALQNNQRRFGHAILQVRGLAAQFCP